MATTATTNLMSLDSIRPASSSTRSTNTLQKQSNLYKDNSYNNHQNFDKMLDKFNEKSSSMSEDIQKIASEVAQETKDPISAAIKTTSAQGKSNKNTQDAPQKQVDSQSNEEVTEIEEIDNPSSPNKTVIMSTLSFMSISIEEQNLAPVEEDISLEETNNNLMSILPQSKEAENKNQDMLNLLSGRTWKINQQPQNQEQADQPNSNQFINRNLAPNPFNQQQMQGPVISEMPSQQSSDFSLQRNFMAPDNHFNGKIQDMPLNSPDSLIIERPTELLEGMTQGPQPLNFMQRQMENPSMINQSPFMQQMQAAPANVQSLQNGIQSNLVADTMINPITNGAEETLPTIMDSQSNNNAQQSMQQNQTPLQSSLQSNVETQSFAQNLSDIQSTNLQAQAQSNQQQSIGIEQSQQNKAQFLNNTTQSPIQNSNGTQLNVNQEQSYANNDNTQNLLSREQPQTGNINNNQSQIPNQNTSQIVESNEIPQSVHQQQPQQVTYQPQNNIPSQQAQPQAQLEMVESPQVQEAISESQAEIINHQQRPAQANISGQTNPELEVENSQPINPSQQTTQQQPQNQQQNMSSQMQQPETIEVKSNNSTENNQQAPTENFAAHLNTAVNNNINNQQQTSSTNANEEQPQPMPTEEEFTNQIVEHARMIRTAQNTEMVIHLKPEHLGELTLRVSAAANGSVNVAFQSDNVQVRAMLENTLAQLKNELANQGLKVENVQVSAHLSDGGMMNGRGQQAWEQNQNQRGNNNSRVGRIGRTEGNGLSAEEESEMVAASVVNNVISADGVDYRV